MAARDLHDVLKLRSEVFVVEQDCVYLDPDGRDADPSTDHLWIRDDDGVVAAAARVLRGPERGVGAIGRIVTRPEVRSRGFAARLIDTGIAILDAEDTARIDLAAQAHLESYYERFGFRRVGDRYVEDDIPHVPMRRTR